MTLTELKYIVAVARERHFGRAADACFVSQPTLSVAIKKLEEELGTQIFERRTSEVTVTPAGERIVGQAQRVLDEAGRIKEIARAGQGSALRPAAARRDLHDRPVPAAGSRAPAAEGRAADAAAADRRTSRSS